VNGDVLHPGQVKYRPGLTVRQAVAVAGGCGRVRPIRGPAPGRSFGEFLYNDGGAIPVPRGSSADG
jgi:hypothetical protein